ncbi:MAG: hypothetical protein ACLUEK_14735 [Oscillospiraceae bacterium]
MITRYEDRQIERKDNFKGGEAISSTASSCPRTACTARAASSTP